MNSIKKVFLVTLLATGLSTAHAAQFQKMSYTADTGETIDIAVYGVDKNLKPINHKADEPCSLYIHGNSAPFAYMEESFNLRRTQGECAVGFDLPGNGNSDRLSSTPYLITLHKDVMRSVVNNTHIGDFVAVGFSLGSNIALQAKQDDYVNSTNHMGGMRGLAIVSGYLATNNPNRGLPIPIHLTNEAVLNNYSFRNDLNYEQETAMALSHFSLGYDVPDPIIQSTVDCDDETRIGLVVSIVSGLMHDDIDVLARLLNEGFPTVYFMGNKEQILSPDYVNAVNESFLGGQLNIVEFPAGHAIMAELPEKFDDQLGSFIRDHVEKKAK